MQQYSTGNDNQINEQIVIADECGDALWDAVLNQKDILHNQNIPDTPLIRLIVPNTKES